MKSSNVMCLKSFRRLDDDRNAVARETLCDGSADST
jgi:hypothetical protein